MALIKSTRLEGVDAVLLDLQLPYLKGDRTVNSMAGLRILEELRHRQRFYGTNLAHTNSKAAADGERALAGGCDGYLCKRARIFDIPSVLAELKVGVSGGAIIVSSH